MARTTLALALHNHQPVGNFESVFERAYRQAYEPMVAALERHPGVRVALHYSGPLLDWLQENHADFLARVRALVARGQAEIMTGGYYEPILPAIPDRDKVAQVLKMSRAVRALFGAEATGLWLAERVWEPHLPKSLAAAGVRYTIVDDTHFLHVGLTEADLVGHYVTEEDGATLAILPSLKALRYRIPWMTVGDLMAWLRQQGSDEPRLLLMGDDGEKFGLWPGTDRLCWERGWVEAFFGALEDARDEVALVTPGEWVRERRPRGRIYLPTASYDEMTEWALPAAAAARLPAIKHRLEAEGRADVLAFVRGGFWRHFLVKYPEINTMHKAMLRVSHKVWRMRPGPRRDAALEHLWAGQCNCPYWHGVFGGIYLSHIRTATFAHLIAAERIADGGRRRRWAEARTEDLDADAMPEVLVRTDAQVLAVDPQEGGSVVEWDVRDAGINLVNTLTRREEGYHQALRDAVARGEVALFRPDETETIHTARVRVKEWGLERYLVADWYRRTSFLEHFLEPGGSPEAFARAEVRELGDFVNQPYEATTAAEGGAAVVRLVRRGRVWVDGVHLFVQVEKTLRVPSGATAAEVQYRVVNLGDRPLVAEFGIETNWGVTSPDATLAAEGTTARAGATARLPGVRAFTLRDATWGLAVDATVEASGPPVLWLAPIEVVSASEAGYERTFQGASLVAVWPLHLEAGGVWEGRLLFTVRPARPA